MLLKEVISFLTEYKVVSLAVAFVIGTASTNLVDSLVRNIILPLAAPLQAAETWDKAVFSFGPVTLTYGAFLDELINFIILASLIFLLARQVLKLEKAQK